MAGRVYVTDVRRKQHEIFKNNANLFFLHGSHSLSHGSDPALRLCFSFNPPNFYGRKAESRLHIYLVTATYPGVTALLPAYVPTAPPPPPTSTVTFVFLWPD
jgi:hypothetical protein